MYPDNEIIRCAATDDLPAIDRIYNQAVGLGFRTAHITPLSLDERINWFRSHEPDSYPVFVLTRGSDLLGWISLSPYRPGRAALDEVAEVSFYVDFQYHGQGIGSKLIEYCIGKSRDLGKRVLFSIIIEGNQESLGLLLKFGFEQWGYLPEVIHHMGQKRGHIYMGKLLDQ